MNTLIVIPARAGSKGIPGKNVKFLAEKPLISYTLEYALKIKQKSDFICVTSDDSKVIEIAQSYGSQVGIIRRPNNLSTDKIGMTDVVLHAVVESEKKGYDFDKILLLQPTSPFRAIEDYFILNELLVDVIDMVVSVKKSKQNPYYNLFEEDVLGLLNKSKEGKFACRQDCPEVFEYNGSMYLIKKESFLIYGLHGMPKVKKMLMPDERSIDIDDPIDWLIAEFFANSSM
jgi:CMP-N,N'-diacetyllegionaminic acid synthase